MHWQPCPSPAALLAACALLLSVGLLAIRGQIAHAENVATGGCPMSHCDAQATGVVDQPLVPAILTSTTGTALGTVIGQGCAGNGVKLACLFNTDSAPAAAKGSLKMLNATTLNVIWGSAAAANSYNPQPATAAYGQVPVFFSDGTLAAGDGAFYVHYAASGAVIAKLPVAGSGKNFGMAPLSATYGVVSQGQGTLTLVNLATWQNVGSLTLTDPANHAPVILNLPSSSTTNTVYAMGYDAVNNTGILYSLMLNAQTQQLNLRSTFSFTGKSAAIPVVVTPQASGLSATLVLLTVSGLIGDPVPQNRLLALSDSASGFIENWQIPLTASVTVSPTVDETTKSLFYQVGSTPILYQNSLQSGAALQSFNLQKIGGFPTSLTMNGHLGASRGGPGFTLLLAGAVPAGSSAGEYVMEFAPATSPGAFSWVSQIANAPASYLAAWNFAPSSASGTLCPIAIPVQSNNQAAFVRLCDR